MTLKGHLIKPRVLWYMEVQESKNGSSIVRKNVFLLLYSLISEDDDFSYAMALKIINQLWLYNPRCKDCFADHSQAINGGCLAVNAFHSARIFLTANIPATVAG